MIITSKKMLIENILEKKRKFPKLEVSFFNSKGTISTISFEDNNDNNNTYDPIMELIIGAGDKNNFVFTVKSNTDATLCIDILTYDLTETEEKKTTSIIPGLEEISKLYAKQLDWYIEQTRSNEERLDKRLREIMKSQNTVAEIDASKFDFEALIPKLLPLVQIFKDALGK